MQKSYPQRKNRKNFYFLNSKSYTLNYKQYQDSNLKNLKRF